MLACIGCRHQQQLAPDAVYSNVENQLVSGELPKALTQSRSAYESFKSTQPDWATTFRIESAKILIYQGESGDALALLQPPLPGNSSTDSQIKRLIFLSIAQARLGHPDEADRALAEAERQCPNCSLRGELYATCGSVALEKGALDDAERAFQSALAAGRLSGDRFLETRALMNLGVVALQQEYYEDALQFFSDASVIARSIGAKLALEKAVGNIGWIYYKTGDFQRSLINCKEAEAQAAELGSPIDQVEWLNNAGLSEWRLGDFQAARPLYEQSLVLGQSIQNPQEILDAHVALGFLLLRIGDLNAAEIHMHEANRVAAQMGNGRAALDPTLLNALLLDARGDKQGATKQLIDLEAHSTEVPSLQWEAENSLARIYSETGQSTEADLWFKRSIDTFQRQRSSLTSIDSTLPFLANGNDLYASYTEHLIRDHRTDEALNVIDQSRAESLADGLHLSRSQQGTQPSKNLNAKSIATRLHATIMVYSIRPTTSYLWVVTPTRQQFYQLAGSETILPQIELQTRMIRESKDMLSQANSPGQSLYTELVQPAQSLIKKGDKVFIVADDALSGLNFETLQIPQSPGEDSHYWIEDVTLTNAKSLQLLSVKQASQPRYADRRILLMGDPVYQKDEYAELPNAATEVTNVASHFSPDHRAVFTGPQASPETYRQTQPGQFSYIHFVAHATANVTTPLDSAVVLSRSHDDATTYKLYARDILKQNLHADLVTLSACYGSGLRSYSGEGLVGLAWAFLRAGSHQVIGAMWEVSDASTPRLMDHLYSELAKGTQPAAALRSAKLAMIHSGEVYRKPLYWAQFQLYSGA